jgi:excisionase family DNA binding protein
MHQQLAVSIPSFMKAADIRSRATVYKEINSGRLKTIKVGRRRLIPWEAAEDWLRQLQREADAA